MKKIILCVYVSLCSMLVMAQKSLVGRTFEWNYQDTVFKNPFVDVDEVRQKPVRHRYVHGGFDDGTRFSFYFPVKKADFRGRFFQFATPFPDSETSCQSGLDGEGMSVIGFSVSHGAYFVETNSGGKLDFANGRNSRPADIGAYRANAACADFSRVIARQLFGCERPYGYIFGGSGGAYRTTGSIENTKDVWQGAVPFVMGSPQAIPNVFAVRMNCMRVLREKFPQIIDAMDAGGDGNPYKNLTQEEYQALKEATQMGFPLQSWYAWDKMGVHGFRVLYQSVVAMDPTYFKHDFWHEQGYLGANPTLSLLRDHVKVRTTIKRLIDYEEGARLGVAEPLDENNRGSADKAWAVMGTGTEKPAAYEVGAVIPDVGFNGGDMVILSGKAKGQTVQLMDVKGSAAGIAPTNSDVLLSQVQVGDTVLIDNSNFLACQTFYRHQIPSRDYYVWDQFLDVNGKPLYPQRPMLLGPLFAAGAAGTVPTGRIQGKVILLESLMDSECFPWQGDWYRRQVEKHLGDRTDDNFRLWFTDHGVHGNLMDASRTVSYSGIVCQALLDLSDWCERGIAPAKTHNYRLEQLGQVVLPEDADDRWGIQPVAHATVGDGQKKITVKVGDPVTIHVSADVPQGYGKVVRADWTFNKDGKPDMKPAGKVFTHATDLRKARYSEDGCHVEFTETVTYDRPGTYFPAVRIASQRNGDLKDVYTHVENLDRVRIIVK